MDVTFKDDSQKHMVCYKCFKQKMQSIILFSMLTCHNKTIQFDNGPKFPFFHMYHNFKVIDQTNN